MSDNGCAEASSALAPSTPVIASPYLPQEILIMIFLRTIPPNYFLDSSLAAGPDSPWHLAMSMKRSIPLVCWEWYTAGIKFLYEDVVFRRLDQIPALLQTLEASPGNFGQLVEGITTYAFVPSNYGNSFIKYIQRILHMCPRTSRFSFASPCELPTTAKIPALAASITHLQLNASVTSPEMLSILDGVRDNLSWLSIQLLHSPVIEDPNKVYALPKLKHLLIDISPCKDYLSPLGQVLSMPSLERLTFKFHHYDASGPGTLDMATFSAFCRMHGGGVQFLDVYSLCWWTRCYTLLSQGLLDACPVLEHLVLHHNSQVVSHPNVKWVDISTPGGEYNAGHTLRESLTKTAFPKLQHVRDLSGSLALLSDISMLLRPDTVLTWEDAFELEFPGIYIRHDLGYILCEHQVDVDSVYGDSEDEEDSDDEDYATGDSDSSSGSDEFEESCSDAGSECSLGDLGNWEED